MKSLINYLSLIFLKIFLQLKESLKLLSKQDFNLKILLWNDLFVVVIVNDNDNNEEEEKDDDDEDKTKCN